MSVSTLSAFDPHNGEFYLSVRGNDRPLVCTVVNETSRMPTRACQHVKLQGINYIIIIFLRNRLAFRHRNSYHRHVM